MATQAATEQHDDLQGLDPVERRIVVCQRKYGQGVAFSWTAHRLADNGAESLCETTHGIDFDEDSFRVRWGAGHYRRRLRCKGERGHLTQEDFSLEALPGAPKPTHAPQPLQQATQAVGAMPAPMPAGGDLMATVITMMMQQQQTASQQAIAQQQAASAQAIAQQQSQTTMMIEMMRNQNHTPITELAELMVVVKKTAQDEGGGDDSLTAAIGPLLAAMSQSQGAQTGQAVDPAAAEMIRQLAVLGVTTPAELTRVVALARAGKLAQVQAATQQARPKVEPVDPGTVGDTGQASPTDAPEPSNNGHAMPVPRVTPDDGDREPTDLADDTLDLEDVAGVLVCGARVSGDPTVHAMVLDNLLEDRLGDAYPALLAAMPSGGIATIVKDYYPDLTGDQRAWIDQVEGALRAMTDPPPEAPYTQVADQDGDQGDDQTDTTNTEGTSDDG